MTMLSMETSLIRDGRGAMLLSYAGQLNTTTLLKGGTIEHYKAFSRLWNWPLPCILTVLSQREAQSIIVNSPLGNISLSWDRSDGYLETRHFPTQKGFFGRPENHNGTCSLLSWVLPSFSIFNSKLPSNIQCLCT